VSQAFDYAAHCAAKLAVELFEQSLPPYTLLNVNVPDVPQEEIAGVMITRQGLRIYRDELIHRLDPRNQPYYWIGGEPLSGAVEEGTDEWAIENNYVSVTPLQLDLTAHYLIDRLRGWNLSHR
jgi:5'-nucleotidase